MSTVKTRKDSPAANVAAKESKLDTRKRLRLEILAAKVAESRIRCTIGELLVAVRETFYPTDSVKRPTSAQVETFKRWCATAVDIGSSTVDQYIAAYAVITRIPEVVEKVTTTRGLQALGRLNDEELTAAVAKLPTGATVEQVSRVMAQVSKTEKTKQDAATKAGETSAAVKKREAAKRDEDAAEKKLAKVLPGLIVELTAAIEEDAAQGLCDAIEKTAAMVAQCGILSFKVLPGMLATYRDPMLDTENTEDDNEPNEQ